MPAGSESSSAVPVPLVGRPDPHLDVGVDAIVEHGVESLFDEVTILLDDCSQLLFDFISAFGTDHEVEAVVGVDDLGVGVDLQEAHRDALGQPVQELLPRPQGGHLL